MDCDDRHSSHEGTFTDLRRRRKPHIHESKADLSLRILRYADASPRARACVDLKSRAAMQLQLPAPTASGAFNKTPFPHLLVYALERRLSGTFELSLGMNTLA